MPYKDREKNKEYDRNRLKELNQHATNSITFGKIIDQYTWDVWCKEIKRHATRKNHPYSEDFTNDIMFCMMTKGCFYCGQLATTIDRLNSTLNHTLSNCVASCRGCNNSKGTADPATFIRKTYYRVRGKYVDDVDDIWFINKNKPKISLYKQNSKKRGIVFELTKEEFDILVRGDCDYCNRSPTTWFGIDRKIPREGYVRGNVVSCCYDCNLDKLEDDVDTMAKRNERIANRVDNGELVINECLKMILHRGTYKSSKKVCAYGKVYVSKKDASRSLMRSDCYVSMCISLGRHSRDIFEISDSFYEEYKVYDNITLEMYENFTS